MRKQRSGWLIGDPPGTDKLYRRKLTEDQIENIITALADQVAPGYKPVIRFDYTPRWKNYGRSYPWGIELNAWKGFNIGTIIHELSHHLFKVYSHGRDFKAAYLLLWELIPNASRMGQRRKH